MHTDVILTNKRRTRAQSNYTDTKLKAWFRRLLPHPARKRSGPIRQPRTYTGVEFNDKEELQTEARKLSFIHFNPYI